MDRDQGKIIGLLSNSKDKHEYLHFKKIIKRYIEKDIGIIYISNNLEVCKSIHDQFKHILGDKFEDAVKRGQIDILLEELPMEMEECTKGTVYDFLVSKIEKMENNSFKECRVYINLGKEMNFIAKEHLNRVYDYIPKIIKLYNVKFILRFFMDEIIDFNFFPMLSDIGYFIVEDVNDENFLMEHFNKIVTSTKIPPKYLYDNQDMVESIKCKNNNRYCTNVSRVIDEIEHDFKNIFSTISGYAQLAMLKSDSEEVRGYLDTIFNNCIKSSFVVERFRGKHENKKNRSLYNLNTLIMEIAETTFNMGINKLNMDSISTFYSLRSERSILCNKNQIEQVIMNIIDNGIHAIDYRGYILINTYDRKESSVLEIIDNGKGMEDNILRNIFEPYFTTKGNNGVGLGLNIAREILKDHDATIDVESKVGSGTKFTMIFPTIAEELIS